MSYRLDAKWRAQWDFILASKGQPEGVGVYNAWKSEVGPNLTEEDLATRYTVRWGGADWGNSPWRGFFERNVSSTKLVNVFNATDQVFDLRGAFRSVWQLAQTAQKPYSGGFGVTAPDNEVSRYWGRLDYAGVDEAEIWASDWPIDADGKAW